MGIGRWPLLARGSLRICDKATHQRRRECKRRSFRINLDVKGYQIERATDANNFFKTKRNEIVRRTAAGILAGVVLSITLGLPAHASIGDAVAKSLTSWAPDWVVVMALAAMPIVELRGAIPVGIAVLGLNPWLVLGLAVLGNVIPVPLILLALGPLVRASSNIPPLQRLMEAILDRAHKQSETWDKDQVFWGLAMFVGVPLPGTGAWSGAMGAFVLGMPFWPAVFANFAGVCIAGVLVTILSCMGWTGFWTAAIILLVLPFLAWLVRSVRSDPK
jgi:uncharacterized membrane protein